MMRACKGEREHRSVIKYNFLLQLFCYHARPLFCKLQARTKATKLHLNKRKKKTKNLFTNQLNIYLQDPANHFQRRQPNLDCIDLHDLHGANDLWAVQEYNMGKELERKLQFHHERTLTIAPAHCTWIFSHLQTTLEGSLSCITNMT